MRMLGVVVLGIGLLALAYGGFSYTEKTHDAKVGPVEISIGEKHRVNVPVWAGVLFTLVGGGLLIAGKR